MNTVNPYADLILELNNCHFYPATLKTIGKKKETITGLSIYCPAILRDSKLQKVAEVVGDKFSVQYIPNKNEIEITLKNKK